jgi:membrane-associated phospholipid phosphatase
MGRSGVWGWGWLAYRRARERPARCRTDWSCGARKRLIAIVAAVLDASSTPRSHTSRFNRSPPPQAWLLCSAALFLLVISIRWLLSLHTFPGDARAAELGASHKSWLLYAITRAYQQVGRPLVATGEVLVMLAWLWRTSGRRTAQGLFIALLASVSCGVIKEICGPTPLWLALHHVGTNFPSGVVTFVTAAGGYLGAVAWRQGRRFTTAVVIVIIAGAGPARVFGGQHVLSDVLGGYMLGAAWLIAARVYIARADQLAREDGVGTTAKTVIDRREPAMALSQASDTIDAWRGAAEPAADRY